MLSLFQMIVEAFSDDEEASSDDEEDFSVARKE